LGLLSFCCGKPAPPKEFVAGRETNKKLLRGSKTQGMKHKK